MTRIVYIIGLIIVAMAVGHEFTRTAGWAMLGAGLILQAVSVGILDYLDQRMEASRDE
jgi:hypothetical protein